MSTKFKKAPSNLRHVVGEAVRSSSEPQGVHPVENLTHHDRHRGILDAMPEQLFYRRNLPHIVRYDKPTFITFRTRDFRRLSPGARTIVLRHALAMDGVQYFTRVVVVMPDHVHLIVSLLFERDDVLSPLARVMKGLKGASARAVNGLCGRSGPLWQEESFDHIVRTFEWTRRKVDYVCSNPVRAGIVKSAEDYPWLWRSWSEGRDRGPFDNPHLRT